MLPTSYERSKLIAIASAYFPQYQKLAQLEVNMDTITLFPDLNLFDFDMEKVITKLKAQKKFHQAQIVGSIDVTNEEANYRIEKLYQSSLWKYERERRMLWDELFQMFKQNNFNGGLFFTNLVVKYRDELPVSEMIKLLHYASEWVDKEFLSLCIELFSTIGKFYHSRAYFYRK
jgi:hypothetical protein